MWFSVYPSTGRCPKSNTTSARLSVRRSVFFPAYHIPGKITECWLAEREGIFFFITGLLVIKRAWLLDADWLSTHALSWFPTSNGFWKEISETYRFWVWSKRGYFILTWKKIDIQSFGGKGKGFSIQKCIDSQPQKSLSGDGWCRTKHNFMAAKLKVSFFVLPRVALLVSQVTLSA